MRNGNKKILIIVISIFVVLAIAGAVFAYLFIATDVFKSNKELFGKYISQNVEVFNEFKNSTIYDTYKNLKNENTYESETNIKFSNSEGGEVSNPLNDLAIKVTEQKDITNDYLYADAQLLFKDEQYLKFEAIKDSDIYGIRFSNVVKQFVSVRDDEKISEVATDLELEEENLIKIFEILDGTTTVTEEIISTEEIAELKNKYLEIITNNIANGTFSKIKKSMITVNDSTIQTNAYIVNLSSEQVQNVIIEILNILKTDSIVLEKVSTVMDENTFVEKIDLIIEEISENIEMPSIKITVHEQNKKTVRTSIEIGMYKIVIDNLQENGQASIKFQMTKLDAEEQNELNVEITKQKNDTDEIYNIYLETILGEEKCEIALVNELKPKSLKVTLSYIDGIETTSLIVENIINSVDSIEKTIKLDETNNVTLNDVNSERRKTIINLLKENVPVKTEKRIQLLLQALGLINDENQQNANGTTEINQTDINKFNAKFEYYTGNEVSAENVRVLLDIVKTNINSVEITPIEKEEDENLREEEVKENIKLNIEKDKANVELINSILTKIKDDKKYKVTISYKDTNGLIDYINIQEVEK